MNKILAPTHCLHWLVNLDKKKKQVEVVEVAT